MIFRKNEYNALDAAIEAAQRFWAAILCNTRVKETVKQLENLLKPKAAENSNSLVFNYSDDVPEMVTGDATRVQQILMNLIGNAIKFTNNGTVTVNATVKSSHTDVDQIEFTIIDSGIGIVPGKIEAIFEPFTQADGSPTRKYHGTGLGLSIVRQLLDAMNGEISVSSEPGHGSCFTVTMPLQ